MTQSKRLTWVLALNVVMILGLLVVGLSAHSLGALAAGGDYLADSAAIGLGLFAIRIRERRGGTSRATTLVALVNATALLAITVTVIVEALNRLTHNAPYVHGLPTLIVSVVAAVAMVAGAKILSGDDAGDDLHMRSVMLDTVADAASSAAVAASGAIIALSGGYYWLDPAAALIIALVIGVTALGLLRRVVTALRRRETAPHPPNV